MQTAWIDKTVNPCDDFFHYSCGNWIKQNAIPPDRASWGVAAMLQERNLLVLRGLAEDAAEHQDRTQLDREVGIYYSACMNEDAIEKRGVQPLKDALAQVSRVEAVPELTSLIARLHKRQIDAFFEFGSMPDPDNSSINIGGLDQGGLGLPERDYYFRADSRSEELRKKYLAHIAKMFELAGEAPAEADKKAQNVMRIETRLAKASLGVTARRDPKILVHKYKLDALAKLTPAMNWNGYFAAIGAPGQQEVNVAAPDFFRALQDLLGSGPLSDLKDYVSWHVIHAHASELPSGFVAENFQFYGKTLTGARQLRPRWKRCVAATDSQIGDALGRMFVEKTFGEQGKQRTLELVHDIEREMAADIDSLTWMSGATKKQALEKLRAATNKIGYPDKWLDYSSIDIRAGDYLGDTGRAKEFAFERDVKKIGKAVDRSEGT